MDNRRFSSSESTQYDSELSAGNTIPDAWADTRIPREVAVPQPVSNPNIEAWKAPLPKVGPDDSMKLLRENYPPHPYEQDREV